jgi:hypothetical protein
MKSKVYRYLSILAFALTITMLVFASPLMAINAAANTLQVTPPPVDPDPPVVIIPDTGEENRFVLDNWVLWVILGIILLVVLVALIMRAGASGTHHHHE